MSGHSLGSLRDLHLGQVLDNADPESRGRIQVRLHATGLEVWASVLVPSAGNGYGISWLPRQDEQVVLAFISPDLPMVLGAVWSGSSSIPYGADRVEQRYFLQTPQGIKLLLDDEAPKVKIETPNGYHITLDDSGQSVKIERDSEKIEMTPSGITISSAANVKVQASQVEVNASMVQVNAGMSRFSGVVQCDTLITNSVVAASYTPGAGNIW